MFIRLILLVTCALTVRAASTVERALKPLDGFTFRRDYTFDEQLGGWLKFHPMPVEWKEAGVRCFYEGAILASPLNDKITKALSKIMVERGSTTTVIFTGIGNTNAKAEYESMEGVPVTNIWLTWAADPKVKASEENCLVMNVLGSVSVVRCSDPHPFVCYRDRPFSEPNVCGTVDPTYTLNQHTGSCYKLSPDERLNWPDAFKSCAIDGGHLAIINSQEEARILWELSRQYARDNSVLIGFRAWTARRAWINVHGQSLEEAGYSDWRRGEPNNANGNEYCGSLNSGNSIDRGVLNDVTCHDRFPYICEIEPVVGTYK